MITIKVSNLTVDDYASLIIKSNGNYKSPMKRIDDWLAKNTRHRDRALFNYLKKNLHRIIKAKPMELEMIIQEFDSKGYQSRILKPKNKTLNKTGLAIKDVFGYDRFRGSARAVWLSEKLNIKSCTYCNTQYSLTVARKGKTKLLFHLDHFFSQDKYPYLSLSFFNLLPCCSSCNMSKSNKAFNLKEDIHPYVDSLDQIAVFEADHSSLVEFLLNINKNKIKLLLGLRAKHYGDTKKQKKLDNYNEQFKIEAMYDQFNDVVAETYLKSLFYNKYKRQELVDFFKKNYGEVLSDEMIKRFVTGNYMESKDLLKRPLAKMMKDICEDFYPYF
ncbi:hypothetical protein MTsPCn5_28690 [Croceitalea sp. MTPC5]|uniref:hypothetical protein n=1 Tax=Croceitalea sp. MTPC5 TaxID=3056565 RepID=UPI002B3B83B2|nr:hypothetical protein MTsPCn5_28690 [Croceitalea sp. MTPC5]